MRLCGIARQISLSPLVASKWTGGVFEVSQEVVEESLMPCGSAGGHDFRPISIDRRRHLIVIRLHTAWCDLEVE